jgi:tetratricopeptide (TPR) repeat protein
VFVSGNVTKFPEVASGEAALEGGSLLVDLLADLFPGQEGLLFHLLVCAPCRERASTTLLARHGVKLVLPAGPLGTLLGEPCEDALMSRPELAAEGLLAELLAHPAEHHFELLEEPRYQEVALVELLLETSRAEQLRDPERSAHLAFLGGRLACLALGEELEDELAQALTRAGVLQANARRLAGQPEDADRELGNATFYSAPRAERARFYRALGLVRWEQGRLDEAGSHLEDAVRLFGEARLIAEEGEAQTLLGLLYAEQGFLPQCTGSLLAGLPLLVAERRPWLAARGCLTLARALAEAGCPDEAWDLLRRGREHTAAVDDAAEATFLYALQGAALGSLGEGEQARALLEPARSRFFDEGRLPEAALATLELALVLAELGQAGESERLAGDLEERFAGVPAAGEAVAVLRQTRWSERAGLRRRVESAMSALRRLFRMHRLRPRPLPFA